MNFFQGQYDDRGQYFFIFSAVILSLKFGKNRLLDLFLLFDFQGQSDPLNSAFRLTYNMVLNLLRLEEINPEFMLEKSFYQFQNYGAIPEMIDSMYIVFLLLKCLDKV